LGKAYEWLAASFQDDENASAFFGKLAHDEQAHLDLVKYQERVVRKTPGEFGNVEIGLAAVDRTLRKIADFRSTAPTIKDAIRFALDMETEVSEVYAATVMEQSNPSFAQMVKGLATTQKDEHYRQLMQFAKDYPA